MTNSETGGEQSESEPRPAAVTFVTTEHFTLQGARSSTIAEATGRATMFLGAVSGGLVALGLIATAAGVGTAFYAFALILLPTLEPPRVSATAFALTAGQDPSLDLPSNRRVWRNPGAVQCDALCRPAARRLR